MSLDKFIGQRDTGKKNSIDIKKDLERIFKDFRWKMKGILDEEGKIHPIPPIPQVISGIFEALGKEKIIPLAREEYKCKIIEGGSREYPDLVLYKGKLGRRMIAIDIKTARRNPNNPDRCSRMSLGSCAGYFLHPDKKKAGCVFPYGVFTEHWVIGFIYSWNGKSDSLHMVSNIEVLVQPKWKIASNSTATGDTAAIGSVNIISKLKAGKGEFSSEGDFEKYWRERGKHYKR